MTGARLTSRESGPAVPAHTPGPWHAGYDGYQHTIFSRADGWTVATVPVAHNQGLAPRRQADALLLRAAPDLLALAKQYAAECAECGGTGDIGEADMVDCPECADIRTIIDKAEGRV